MPRPSAYHREVLDLVQEENGEVVQAASKVKRFGWDSLNPYTPEAERKPAGQLLEDEFGDLLALQRILVEDGVIDPARVEARADWKRTKLFEPGGALDGFER